MSLVLRPYQVQAVDAALRELAARRKALLAMATGAGKTIVFAALAERWRPLGRVLVLAHREELLDQAAAKIAASTLLTTGIEQADRHVREPLPDVVIASVQTLAQPRRRAAFAPDAFDLVIVDEAHHGTAISYREVLEYFDAAAVLGVTATAERADGAPLSSVFGRTVYNFPIRTAVRAGFLVDIKRAAVILAGLDLGRVRVRAGDFDAAELEAELTKAPAVAAVADAVIKHAGDRPTVLFCAGILHSRVVAAALNARQPGIAAFASGEERQGVADLVAGRVKMLANADLTTEGFDFRPLSCVALVRPTKSTGRATQQVGRGTRLCDGKTDLLVLEFVAARAAGQVSTVDVVGSDMPPAVRTAAERLLDRRPGLSVLAALDQAALAGGVHIVPARAQRAVIDPMRVILGLDGMVMEPARKGAAPASPEQLRQLAAEGLRTAGLDIRQAAILLAGIRWRRARGRATPSQALDLARFGFDLECSATSAARLLAPTRAA